MLNQTRKVLPYLKQALSIESKPCFFHSPSPYTWVAPTVCIKLMQAYASYASQAKHLNQRNG